MNLFGAYGAFQAVGATPQGEVQSSAAAELTLFSNYALGDPWMLALLPCVLAIWIVAHSRAQRPALSGSVPALVAGQLSVGSSWRQTLRPLAAAAELLGLLACVSALARPLSGSVETELKSEGVDIVLCLDRSSSMVFEDMEEGESRLEVVKQVAGAFAERRMQGASGTRDNVGLVAFAHYPDLLCPNTLDINALQGFLDTVQMAKPNSEEDGTAIGSGLARRVAALRDSKAKSRIVVLLSDGETTRHEIEPAEAAKMAQSEGVRVYTILAGRYTYKSDMFGRVVATEFDLDTTEMEALARETGGRFFRASDKQGLEDVYAEIDRMEKTEREELRYVETYDLYPWLLGPGLLLWALAWLWNWTLGRSAP
jgi:Ca-activated chloride channel family protein